MNIPQKRGQIFNRTIFGVFFLALLFAIYLRFYHFAQTYDWSGDNVRDFLVAKHIVKYHDFAWIAPWALAGNNNMVNSVFYYYFLAVFYFFSFGNVLIYQFLVALFFFVTICIFAYFLGKLFFQEKIFQYMSILLFCFLPVMNVYGRSAFQPYFVLPFFMMSIYFYFAAFKQKSIKCLTWAVFFYSIALNLHYAVLVVLPWVLGMTVYLQYVLLRKKTESFNWRTLLLRQLNWPSLIFLLNFGFLLINQIIIKGFGNGVFSLRLFFEQTFLQNSQFYIYNLRDNFYVFNQGFMGTSHLSFLLVLFYLSIFFIFILFFLQKKTFYSVSLFLALLLFPYIFFINLSGDLHYPGHYFASFYILLPTFLISVLSNVAFKKRWILFTILCLGPLLFSYQQFTAIKLISNQPQITKYQTVAKQIGLDAAKSLANQSDFFVFTIDDQLDWSSAQYWFYLEENLNLQLVENTYYRYNIIALQQESKNLYLICDNPRISWNTGRENWCLERLLNKPIFISQVKVFADEAENLFVYRLLLKKPINRYAVYQMIGKN